uniref:Uncharacterized protein n=1 Tax=Staphylothermus marinus TaxID=2280 RepID=A0A7C4DBH1_STAMA
MKHSEKNVNNPLHRSYIALVLLAVFFVLTIILPRIITIGISRNLLTTIGSINIEYKWMCNKSLSLIIKNNYSVEVKLEVFKCGFNEYFLNNTIVKPGEVIVIDLKMDLNKTCLATLTYSINGYKYGKLIVIEPFKNSC